MFLKVFPDGSFHPQATALLVQYGPDFTVGLEGKKLLRGELQAGDGGVVLAHAHEALRIGTGAVEVVAHRLHQRLLGFTGDLEAVDDAPVDDLLGGQDVEHVGVADDVLRVLVVRKLVGVLDDGVHGAVLLPDFLVTESHGAVDARVGGGVLHLGGLGVFIEDEHATLAAV